MAEAATLAPIEQFDEIMGQEQFVPLTVVVPEMAEDSESRLGAARFMGSVMTAGVVEVTSPEVQKPIESLFEAIPLAAEGDEDAYGMVYTNAKTDVIERTLKKGHVMDPISLHIQADGRLAQHRQAGYCIQANSLLYAADDPVMRRRTEAETRNLFRTEALYKDGWFEDYSLLVISRAENKPGVFFTETMSCSLQLTHKSGDELAIESAFVAGIKDDGEQHDEETVVKLGRMLDADFEGMTPAEIIDTPLLVHNSLVANGVVDVVELYDIAAGGTFFGETRPQEDYRQYRQKCTEREKSFEPRVEAIVTELLAEAATITSPEQAVTRLNKISGKHMVEHAMVDRSIDARVFGAEAAGLIEQGRMLYERGQLEALQRITEQAVKVEKSISCPSSMASEGAKSGESNSAGSDKYGSLEFKCPKCKQTNTRPQGKLIPNCLKCGADVRC